MLPPPVLETFQLGNRYCFWQLVAWGLELCGKLGRERVVQTAGEEAPQALQVTPQMDSRGDPECAVDPFSALRMRGWLGWVCRYVHPACQPASQPACEPEHAERGRPGPQLPHEQLQPDVSGRSSAVGSGHSFHSFHSFPPGLGKEKPRNQGIEWKRLDPGAGDHPPSSSSCSNLPQTLIIPGQARPIQPFWRGRPETRPAWPV